MISEELTTYAILREDNRHWTRFLYSSRSRRRATGESWNSVENALLFIGDGLAFVHESLDVLVRSLLGSQGRGEIGSWSEGKRSDERGSWGMG